MKKVIGIIVTLMIGSFIGFFGVFASVFSDGAMTERLSTISAILLIYLVWNGISGFLLPEKPWLWGLLSGAPGSVLLLLFLLKEPNLYFLVYILLIIGFSCSGVKLGSFIRKRLKRPER